MVQELEPVEQWLGAAARAARIVLNVVEGTSFDTMAAAVTIATSVVALMLARGNVNWYRMRNHGLTRGVVRIVLEATVLILLWQIATSAIVLDGKPVPLALSVGVPLALAATAVALAVAARWSSRTFRWSAMWRFVAVPTLAPTVPFVSHAPGLLSLLRDLAR